MNLVYIVFGIIAACWALAILTLGIADSILRKRELERLAIQDFRAKIQAMRRMAEREGNV